MPTSGQVTMLAHGRSPEMPPVAPQPDRITTALGVNAAAR